MCLEISVKSLRKNLDFILSFKTKHRISYKNRDVHSEIYSLYSSLYRSIMNSKKRSETLLIVIEQHLVMRDIIDSLLVKVCREENVSPEKVFFAFFCCFVIIIESSRKNLCNRSFCISSKKSIKISGVGLKRSGISSGDNIEFQVCNTTLIYQEVLRVK